MRYSILAIGVWLLAVGLGRGTDIFVAPDGVDVNPGTRERPIATLDWPAGLTRVG